MLVALRESLEYSHLVIDMDIRLRPAEVLYERSELLRILLRSLRHIFTIKVP